MDENNEKKGGKVLAEFKEFISRGNVMDMAIGIIVGGAFKAIVDSLVNDIVMPVIGVITGGIDFSSLAAKIGDASINYGMFIQSIIDFLLTAVVIFLLVKAINKFRRKKEEEPEPEPEPEPSEEAKLLTEIRDYLAKK